MDVHSATGSWAGLVELRPALRRFVSRRCRDEGEAEDIVQEALIRAWRYRASLIDATRLRPWLMRIALNVFRDHVRREKRLPRVDVEPELFDRLEGREDVPGEPRVEPQVELEGAIVGQPRVLDHLCDAREALRDPDRDLLDSYYDAGRSCSETAQVCEIPAHLVKVRLYRARHRLRRVVRSRLRVETDPLFDESGTRETPGKTEGGVACAAGRMKMKILRVSSGLSGLVLIPFLATPPIRAIPASADLVPDASSSFEAVPRLESSAAQLAHAAACKTAMRGKAGAALESARKAAIEAYRAVREHFAADARACAEASFRAGELLRASSDSAGALAEFQLARERGADTPFRVRAVLEIGHIHRRGRKHAETLTAYESVLVDPGATPSQRDDASYWIGQVHLVEGRIEDARRAWKRVAEEGEDPLDRIRAWDCIALTFVASGDLEGAAGVVERCREALSEVSAEETRLGERVRDALSTMRVLDDLQRAVQEREASKTKKESDRTDGSRDDGEKKK